MTAIPTDTDGCFHFTYVTYHPDTGEWYGGKHTTSNLDDGYLGSGNWVRNHPARGELVIEIIEFFRSEQHAYAAEAELVNFAIIDADALCRNEMDGGLGCSSEAASRRWESPIYQQRVRDSLITLYASPEGQQRARERNARITASPDWRRKQRAAVMKLWADPEHRRKQLAAMKILWADPVWRQKHQEGIVRMHADAEFQRKNSEANKRKATNPAWRQKMTEINRQKAADPAWRQKMSEVATRREANRRRILERVERRLNLVEEPT